MADDKKTPEDEGTQNQGAQDKGAQDKGREEKKSKWSTGAKVGAAVGSAAVAAALIYAGRHKMRKMDEFNADKPKPGTRYENEPVDDADEEGEE